MLDVSPPASAMPVTRHPPKIAPVCCAIQSEDSEVRGRLAERDLQDEDADLRPKAIIVQLASFEDRLPDAPLEQTRLRSALASKMGAGCGTTAIRVVRIDGSPASNASLAGTISGKRG
jgi:hypothetical protein